MRGRGRDDVRLLVSDGADRVEHATFRDLPTPSSSGRPHRREHVGDHPRRDRRPRARRARGAHPLLDRAARRALARRGTAAGRRHDRRRSTTTSPGRRHARGGGHLHAARALRRLAAAVARVAASARHGARPPAPGSASRSATATHRAPGRSRAYQQIFGTEPGQRGDAERVAPVHARARRRPRAARRHDRADPPAHRRVVARRQRDAVPRALPRARRRPRTS